MMFQQLSGEIVTRKEWGAREPKLIEKFKGPAPYVVIHHSYIPAACYTNDDCNEAMRSMQDFHQLDRGWNDLGYSFAIGGNGLIYHGRGFNTIGAHAPKYNDKSVGICLIGDWSDELPPEKMLVATKNLIEFGIDKGYIAKDYQLVGHRQVRDTSCPGERLYKEIQTWKHYVPSPHYNQDINEIPDSVLNNNTTKSTTTKVVNST
ncbi:PGRPLB family protein [Megaselia abdita]